MSQGRAIGRRWRSIGVLGAALAVGLSAALCTPSPPTRATNATASPIVTTDPPPRSSRFDSPHEAHAERASARAKASSLSADDDESSGEDNSPQRRALRSRFANEREDASWTLRIQSEIDRTSAARLRGPIDVDGLSCRETLCRAYLKFDDELDVAAFQQAPHDPELRYEFQSLDPDYRGEGFDNSGYTYELMIERPVPANNVAPGSRDSAERVDGNADERNKPVASGGPG